ncbi:MAG TPA: hypothetical protein VEK07_12395, partial [Polyangiaceae bacterium]|nr:hypothetical protein [Polyangiaceae bacterium]
MARSKTLVKAVFSFCVLASGHGAAAADCYVDSVNGSDSNDGTSSTAPVQSQAAIPSGCTAVYYARGSQFNEATKIIDGATTYANYGDSTQPLPDFKLPKGTAGSVFQTFNANITIDGLKFEGSHNTTDGGNGSVSSFVSGSGICVYLQGQNTTIRNSEVTDCDFEMMLQGDGSLATNNYVHDVNGQALDGTTSSDPNSVGGG